MKKKILSAIILFCFIFCGCTQKTFFATDENFIKIMTRTDEDFNYEIDCKIEGNFTNSGHKEVLVFFNGKHKKHNESRSWDALVFIVDEQNEIVNFYQSLKLYKKKPLSNFNFIKEIDKFEIKFDNAVITDFNGNGLLEFIYFESAGSVYQFFICEFKNGSFEYICQTNNSKTNTPGLYNYDLDHFDFEEKSMYLHSFIDNEKIKLKWNPETQFYDKEIISDMYTQLDSKLTDSDLTDMSKALLRRMRNAVYARHGRIFNSYDLQRFFGYETWYKPNPNYSDDMLTEIDKYNIELIQKYEAKQ